LIIHANNSVTKITTYYSSTGTKTATWSSRVGSGQGMAFPWSTWFKPLWITARTYSWNKMFAKRSQHGTVHLPSGQMFNSVRGETARGWHLMLPTAV